MASQLSAHELTAFFSRRDTKISSDVPKIAKAVTPISDRFHDEAAHGNLLGLERVPREHCSVLVLFAPGPHVLLPSLNVNRCRLPQPW